MSLTEAESQAAAALTGSILGQLAEDGYDKAAELLGADAPAEPVAAAPAVVPSTPAPAAEAAAPPAPPAATEPPPSFEPDIPDDLRELLDTPDFDAEADAEVDAELEALSPDDFSVVDPDQAKRTRALEKRNAWLEERLVERSRGNWVAENLRAYPLLREYAKTEVEAINATSRRGFAREAAALNARLETIAKPMLADIAALRETLKMEAVAQGKTEAAQRWGNVPGDVPGAGASVEHAAELAAAEKTGDLKEVFKVMLKANPLA